MAHSDPTVRPHCHKDKPITEENNNMPSLEPSSFISESYFNEETVDDDLMFAGPIPPEPILNENGDGLFREDNSTGSDSETGLERDHFEFRHEQGLNRRPGSPAFEVSEESEEFLPDPAFVFDSDLGNETTALSGSSVKDIEDNILQIYPRTPELETTMKFIRALRLSRLDASGLTSGQILRLKNPGPPSLLDKDSDTFFSLQQYLATLSSPEKAYQSFAQNYNVRHLETPMLSLTGVRNALADYSGVYGIATNMCINSCMAFSGPFKDFEECTFCGSCQYYPQTRRNKTRKPLRQFYSIPVGPQIQALWASPGSSAKMRYQREKTTEIINGLQDTNGETTRYDDILNGTEYLEAVNRGDTGLNDTLLLFAMDGAQLYPDKQSDCWIFIFTLLELSPEFRFLKKYAMVASCIPGPQKPQHFDSFLFPTFQHIAAINNDGGLRIWDVLTGTTFSSKLFCFLSTADGLGSVYFTGLVGYHGAFPCRLFCGIKGRHKPRIPCYYPTLLKPNNYTVSDCAHEDVNVAEHSSTAAVKYYESLKIVLQSTNQTNYKKYRKLTGISKPPLILGLDLKSRLPLYAGLSGDAMHVTTLNLGELLIPLWKGTFPGDGTDNIINWDWAIFRDGSLWQEHGKRVAECKPFIPSSFDHPPRNIAEKLNSGYKAKEWQNYLLGLAPALLFLILPTEADLLYAQNLLDEFVIEFEKLYIQRRADRLHFARPCVHATWHLGLEIARLGPSCFYAAWTMERTIGNLGEEIRSDLRPYANLMEWCLLRCQVNTIKILYPELDSSSDSNPPLHSVSLGENYTLLRARDKTPRILDPTYFHIIKNYLIMEGFQFPDKFSWKFHRWARLSLPNGQIARSAWKELERKNQDVRCSRNVKFFLDGESRFGEVQFYLHLSTPEKNYGFALIQLHSTPESILYQTSCGTVICVHKLQGEAAFCMIPATSIDSVVSVQPWDEYSINSFFIWQRTGIALSTFSSQMGSEEEE